MYRALYRKWRPQRFADVVGQTAIVTALQNQIAAGRIGHAYLFTGTRGTGKTTCAKIFAKAVNCLDTSSPDPCGECEICKGIDSGAIMDIIEMDAASNNGVDDIRDLRDEVAYLPSVCKYKVYIIDEVHMLSTAAFNALLKTMEEPPEHVIFILATTPGGDALFEAVRRGLKAEAHAAAQAALAMREPLDVVNTSLIPALDAVGDGFEKGTVFLPQLLQAATAAQAAFEAIKAKIAASGQQQGSKGKIVIATVKGDIHDIGKNIVRVILENYGYDVLDLGRDVDPERVVEAVRQTGAKLVGLSALMTTTVPSMQATIEALHAAGLDCKVMVGGAVLTPDYARDIGADYYCKDAKASADLAKQLLG